VSISDRRVKLKIAIVVESFNPHAGGLERSTSQIAQELVTRGHEVTLLAGGCRDTSCLPSVTIQAMGRGKSSSVIRLLRFTRWARVKLADGGFDVSLSMTTAIAAQVIQPRGGTARETLDRNIAMRPTAIARLVKRLGLLLSPKHQVLLYLERQTLSDPGTVKVAAVSRYVTEQLQNHYGFSPDKIELIPNAAVMPPVSDDQRADWRKRIRDGFDISDDVPAYLFAAINPRLKGFEPLMRALAILKERGIPGVVLLAGDFWHGHNKRAAELGVRDRVRFVRHTKQIQALFAAADVTVHPTFYDPASKVVIESLLMGVPAISTSYNGASDLIGSDRGRVIDDPADAVALADAMQALADPAERARCREAIAAMPGVSGGLTMSDHVDQLEALLRQVVSDIEAKPVG